MLVLTSNTLFVFVLTTLSNKGNPLFDGVKNSVPNRKNGSGFLARLEAVDLLIVEHLLSSSTPSIEELPYFQPLLDLSVLVA